MPVYFDPAGMTNAFASGAQIGGGIRKNETQAKLAPMIAAGDYKGANAFAASRGDLEMMDYLRPMAKEADDQAWNKKYGGMLAAGDYKGAAALGFADGKIDQALGAREYGRALKAEEITDYRTGLEFLDSNAEEVMKNFTPEQRKDEYIRRVAASPFGQDPNIMQALERAGADGMITDDEVISFRRELMTAGERQAKADSDRSFEYGVSQDKQAQSNWERSFAADEAARATPSTNRERAEDQNGVLRYLDTGEPVFPNVTAAPEPPAPAKPLIGSEAMARVTAGLPNAKQAVEDLDRLVFRSKGTFLSAKGYDPASDLGAAAIEAIPDFGLLKGVARTMGGEDYQLFKDSYGSFEAAMLPIISGAAITESEGLRQMRALEIKPGDSEQTKTRKIAGMRAMVQGVEMAARGDTAGFISMLDQAGSISGAGPVKRSGAAAPVTGLEDASDDDLFMIMRGN